MEKSLKENLLQASNLFVINAVHNGLEQIFILEKKKLELNKTDISNNYNLISTISAYFDVFTKQFCGTSEKLSPMPISHFLGTNDKKEEYTIQELKNLYKKYIASNKSINKNPLGFDITNVKKMN